jgi:protease-4
MQDPLDTSPLPSAPSPATATIETAAPGWERQTLERLAFESLREQRASRRWKYGLRLAWLVFLALLAWHILRQNVPTTSPALPHTALVEIRGEITPEGETSAESIMAAMRAALADSGSKALVLRIDSPGGSPVQAGLISDEVRRLRALHDKPIFTVVEESCASAAYYIASATDRIYVNKASIVGSIGVLMDGFGFTGLMEKLGIERRLLTAGDNKGFLDPFSPQTDAQRKHAQAMLEQIHRQFIEVVRQGRGTRLKESPDMFSGLFWTGQQAVDMGLADDLGSLDRVARDVVKVEEVVDYTQRANVAERLAKRFGAAVGEGAVRTLRTLPPLR